MLKALRPDTGSFSELPVWAGLALAIVVSLGLAVAARGSDSAAPPSSQTLELGSYVAGVAADGARAATVVTGTWSDAGIPDTGLVWTLASDSVKRSKPMRGPGPWCERESVAIAGPLVAWRHVCESNNAFRQAIVVWAPPRTPRVVAAVNGPRLSKPIADGSVLVFRNGRTLFRVHRDGGVHPIATGVEVTDVDRGRIAGWLADGTLAILDPSGHRVRSLDVGRELALDVQLDGSFLLVKRYSKVEIRSSLTGALLRTFPIDGGWGPRMAAAGGIAAVSAGNRISVIRLSDARRIVLRRSERFASDVVVEPVGVFFAEQAEATCPPRCGRLTFVPRNEIDKKLRRAGP
ncbi:MAG TPA: hypothetical protein VNP93_11890 [Gaiellaceae bacterium]|nr:hypothetical protein [Gaiellaceae bacterium]